MRRRPRAHPGDLSRQLQEARGGKKEVRPEEPLPGESEHQV